MRLQRCRRRRRHGFLGPLGCQHGLLDLRRQVAVDQAEERAVEVGVLHGQAGHPHQRVIAAAEGQRQRAQRGADAGRGIGLAQVVTVLGGAGEHPGLARSPAHAGHPNGDLLVDFRLGLEILVGFHHRRIRTADHIALAQQCAARALAHLVRSAVEGARVGAIGVKGLRCQHFALLGKGRVTAAGQKDRGRGQGSTAQQGDSHGGWQSRSGSRESITRATKTVSSTSAGCSVFVLAEPEIP